MADIKFSCPKCGQAMEAHEQWGGEQVQCPTCKTDFAIPKPPPTVPQAPTIILPPSAPASTHQRSPAPPPSSMAPPPPKPPSETKLKFAAHTPAAERATPPPPPTRFSTAQNPAGTGVEHKKKSGVVKAIVWVVILAACGVGGYFGYGWFKDYRAKQQAALTPPPPPVVVTNTPVAPDAQPPLATTEAVWTLDLDSAQTPEGRAAGNIAGRNFVLASAHLFITEAAQVLSLRSDTNTIPDRQLLIYLHAKPGESLAGRSWSVTTNGRDADVPYVIRSAKPGPQFAPELRKYSTGFALKLELGAWNGSVLPGKIFIGLPDAEQTVVAGQFNVTTNQPPPK